MGQFVLNGRAGGDGIEGRQFCHQLLLAGFHGLLLAANRLLDVADLHVVGVELVAELSRAGPEGCQPAQELRQ